MPQSQTAALHRPKEEEETDKSKQAQTELVTLLLSRRQRSVTNKVSFALKMADVEFIVYQRQCCIKINEKDRNTLKTESYAKKYNLSWVFGAYRKIRPSASVMLGGDSLGQVFLYAPNSYGRFINAIETEQSTSAE